jgi:hypothetical protein
VIGKQHLILHGAERILILNGSYINFVAAGYNIKE